MVLPHQRLFFVDFTEVCGIKRKSEVGLESDEKPIESSEKKQKVEESEEPEVATNGC